MFEYGYKIEEEVKAMQSEIKKNIQGSNSEEEETRTQINDLEQNEETRIQKKNEERLRNLQDILKRFYLLKVGLHCYELPSSGLPLLCPIGFYSQRF